MSIAMPTPRGGWKPIDRSATPRLPPPSGKVSAALRPMRSIDACTGPMTADRLPETSALSWPSMARMPRVRVFNEMPPNDRPTGMVASRPALPCSAKPLSLDSVMPKSNSAFKPSAGRIFARNPSPSPAASANTALSTAIDRPAATRPGVAPKSAPNWTLPSSRRVPFGSPTENAGVPSATRAMNKRPVALVNAELSGASFIPCGPIENAGTWPSVSN